MWKAQDHTKAERSGATAAGGNSVFVRGRAFCLALVQADRTGAQDYRSSVGRIACFPGPVTQRFPMTLALAC